MEYNINRGNIVYIEDFNDICCVVSILNTSLGILYDLNSLLVNCSYTIYEVTKININDIEVKIIRKNEKLFIYPYIYNKDLVCFGKYLEDKDNLLTIRNHVWRKLNHYRDNILNEIY
ncbi:MAG: hypothetical protein ACFFG0_05285 [Candidatus Thorarchaeota archaeon]